MKLKFLFSFLIILAVSAWGQSGSLRGQVTDPSGAVVANATVTITGANHAAHSATTDQGGNYEVGNLPPGNYSVQANAKGFSAFGKADVEIRSGEASQLNIPLEVYVEKEKIEVQDQNPSVDVNPSNNAGALVLSGKDLDALPDDPDELQQDLQALAGPSAGPDGGQIYIDGFTAGQLPPKSSIREIRINQNPFSAEYDKLGYGRIEIFTKPGTDKYHGQLSVVGNASGLNSSNPFVTDEQPYYSTIFMGNVGGPINKKASFYFDVQRRNINEVAIINANVLDANLLPAELSQSIANPRTRTNLGPRIDYQISPNNTLTARYQYFHDSQDNAGIGQLALASTGYNESSTEHTLQISDTQILGAKAVNETRFQYLRENSQQNPVSSAPTLNVIGAFVGGGSSQGRSTDHTEHYELQNYASVAVGSHFLKFGGRLRVGHEVSASSEGFNGTFTFPSLAAYQGAQQFLAAGGTTAPGANQFSIASSPTGVVPSVAVTVADVGLYWQDDWRLRPNITLSYGLRFETQNAIHDHGDWAPRLAFAWGIGGKGKNAPKTVLRAGFGMFYNRFSQDNILTADRLNGITQQEFVVSASPTTPINFYPLVPAIHTLPVSQTTPTIYQLNDRLRPSYIIQSAVTVERQLTKAANVTVSYLNSRGVHQFLSWNANAPLPGTPNSLGPRPDPTAGNIYQYASEGSFRQNQLISTFTIRAGTKLSLFGNYALNYAHGDTVGVSSFPSNQYDLAADYGRSTFDVRHKLFLAGTVSLPHAVRLSPFIVATSGTPYNVTVGEDLSGDSLFNDRPAFATNLSGSCLSVTAACHYVVPTGPYTPVPINYLTGPAHFTVNLRLSKTFGFGPENGNRKDPNMPRDGGPGGPGGGGDYRGGGGVGFGRPAGGAIFGAGPATTRRYNLTFSINARNLFNRVNLATPIGNLNSQFFGQSIALAGGPFSSAASNRRIELQASWSF